MMKRSTRLRASDGSQSSTSENEDSSSSVVANDTLALFDPARSSSANKMPALEDLEDCSELNPLPVGNEELAF